MKNLAMAIGMAKRNKMASGGMVNPKLNPGSDEATTSHIQEIMKQATKGIVDNIMAKKMSDGGMCYADGGMVEELESSDADAPSLSDDDDMGIEMLSDGGMADPENQEANLKEEDPMMKRKAMLKDIMSRRR